MTYAVLKLESKTPNKYQIMLYRCGQSYEENNGQQIVLCCKMYELA